MKRHGLTQIELVVILFISLALVTVTLAAVGSLDNINSKAKCAANLRQIGTALQQYSNDSRGTYPRTKFDMSSADKPVAFTGADAADPFGAGGPNANDVSADLYLLLRTEDIASSAFICPATGRPPFNFGGGAHTAQDKSNFPSPASLSYSYANPYPDTAASNAGFRMTQGMDPSFALAADSNPGGDALTTLTANMTDSQLRKGNSLNHGGDGQNVLYGDGHVGFQNSPLCGSHRDNIYTYGDSGVDPNTNVARPTGGLGVMGSPVEPGDSVLLPVSNLEPLAATPLGDASSAAAANSLPAAQETSSALKLTIAILIVGLIAAAGLVVFLMGKKGKGERTGS